MSDCCSCTGAESAPKRASCPANGQTYPAVPTHTVLHHVRRPWEQAYLRENFYFCDSPTCDVVYFTNQGKTIRQSELRTPVGVKEGSEQATLCYCFGVTRRDYREDPDSRSFLLERTASGNCACESRNPSGRCCLKDFPKARNQ